MSKEYDDALIEAQTAAARLGAALALFENALIDLRKATSEQA